MSIRQYFIITIFLSALFLLLANATGVPQAVTKAPGEASNNSCATCHTPAGSFNTTIALEVLNSNNIPVQSYNLGETYTVKVLVSGTNNPKAYGFQMSCQDSLTNTDLGIWSEFGERVKQQNLSVLGKQRKYLVQSAAKTDGIFTAKWKAPNTNMGKIKFYFSGLAINLNGNTNGDNNAFGQKTLNAPEVSSANYVNNNDILIYPNPAHDFIQIQAGDLHTVRFVSLIGETIIFTPSQTKEINIQTLTSGVYLVECYDNKGQKLKASRFVKL